MDKQFQHEPEGSKYDKIRYKRQSRAKRRRLKKRISRKLVDLVCIILPLIYRCYMQFVFVTSSSNGSLGQQMKGFMQRGENLVAIMWHDEVFSAPYLFKDHGFSALASTGTLGRLVTTLLEDNGFTVFRGGRKRKFILRDMIRYMLESEHVFYGITVDGSKGPPKIMKRGACIIARESGRPLFLLSSQAKNALHCSTWDRTLIPLPFNHFETQVLGPYWIDPLATKEHFTSFCEHIQSELFRLSHSVFKKCKHGTILLKQNENKAITGTPYTKWDLQTKSLPPWADNASNFNSILSAE